jgi:hypothetical protein
MVNCGMRKKTIERFFWEFLLICPCSVANTQFLPWNWSSGCPVYDIFNEKYAVESGLSKNSF